MKAKEKKIALVGIFQTEFHRRLDSNTEACRAWFDWVGSKDVQMPLVIKAIQALAKSRCGNGFSNPPGLSEVQWMYNQCKPPAEAPLRTDQPPPECRTCNSTGIVWIIHDSKPRRIACKCHHGVKTRDDCFPGADLFTMLRFLQWGWKQTMYKSETEAKGAMGHDCDG